MFKKVLIPILLLATIAFLAYQFFKPNENVNEELNAFALLPSTTIAFEINSDDQDNFLGLNSTSKSRFICDDFPDEIAECIILRDSLLNSDSALANINIEESYSNQNIFKTDEKYFFIDGRKVFSSGNIVLLKQLLLKVQNQDYFTPNKDQSNLQALVKESRIYFAVLKQNIFIEYNEVNELALAYRYFDGKNGLAATAINFLPKSAKNISLNNDTLQFNWGEKAFFVCKDVGNNICKNKYRDAQLCNNNKQNLALINGVKIGGENHETLTVLLDEFYAGKCFKNERANSNIDYLNSYKTLPKSLKMLLPKSLENSVLISYKNGKSLQVIKFETANEQNVNFSSSQKDYSIDFDQDIIWGPFAVKNHRSKSKCIFVQTSDNTLFYLNSKGKQLWKASIDGKILGKPLEIDRYHNNKVQYVFNTEVKLYQLDVLGRNLDAYPKRQKATGPVSLVVYKAKKERLLIPSGNTLVNLYLDGRETKGWKSKKFLSDAKEIAYTKQKSKDCIMVICSEHVYILNPRGEERIMSKKLIQGSIAILDNNNVQANIFSLNESNQLQIGNTNSTEMQLFSEDSLEQILNLGNYVYAISSKQLILFTSDGNLVENRFLNESPIVLQNGVLYNSDNNYTAFISPGTKLNINKPIKALRLIHSSDKIIYSENQNLFFVDNQ